MIIQILSELKEEGYLARGRHPTVAPFFAGANVAMRRQALEDIGGYDPRCVTGEDCDICARLCAADWELYLRRDAVVLHKNPATLKRLLQQWYGYGRYHPYVFAKHNEPAVEIYARLGRPVAGERYQCLFYRRSSWALVIFVTTLLMFHFALTGTVLAWLAGWPRLGGAGLAATLMLALGYAWPDLKHFGLAPGAAFAGLRYLADLALFTGALVGGLHQRMLYLSPPVD
jgi:cellulose synthase/poly-beta-1,6-N-acetylglucosamine synthase-like glycosyltransferase